MIQCIIACTEGQKSYHSARVVPGSHKGVADLIMAQFHGGGVKEEAGILHRREGLRYWRQLYTLIHRISLHWVQEFTRFVLTLRISEAQQAESGLLEASKDNVPLRIEGYSLWSDQCGRLTAYLLNPLRLFHHLSLQFYLPHSFRSLLRSLRDHRCLVLLQQPIFDLRAILLPSATRCVKGEVERGYLLDLLLLFRQDRGLFLQPSDVLRILIATIFIKGTVLCQLLQGGYFSLQAGELTGDFSCAEGDTCVFVMVEGVVDELWLEIQQKHKQNIGWACEPATPSSPSPPSTQSSSLGLSSTRNGPSTRKLRPTPAPPLSKSLSPLSDTCRISISDATTAHAPSQPCLSPCTSHSSSPTVSRRRREGRSREGRGMGRWRDGSQPWWKRWVGL